MNIPDFDSYTSTFSEEKIMDWVESTNRKLAESHADLNTQYGILALNLTLELLADYHAWLSEILSK